MSEFSKFLRLEFFKRQGFPTKMDGVEFVEKTPQLKKLMAKLNADIEDYKSEKVDEFEKGFSKYENEKKVFLVGVKDKIRERKEVKKEVQKQALKNELRAELLKEMEEEKESQLAKEHAEMFPVYDKDDLEEIINIDKKFTAAIKNKENLTKKQLEELKVMKKESEKAISNLMKINNTLNKYAQQ